jgi:hypothetical protein
MYRQVHLKSHATDIFYWLNQTENTTRQKKSTEIRETRGPKDRTNGEILMFREMENGLWCSTSYVTEYSDMEKKWVLRTRSENYSDACTPVMLLHLWKQQQETEHSEQPIVYLRCLQNIVK